MILENIKTMKNQIIYILTLAVLVAAFTDCGSKSTNPNSDE